MCAVVGDGGCLLLSVSRHRLGVAPWPKSCQAQMLYADYRNDLDFGPGFSFDFWLCGVGGGRRKGEVKREKIAMKKTHNFPI